MPGNYHCAQTVSYNIVSKLRTTWKVQMLELPKPSI